MEVMLLRDEKIASFKKRRKPGYPKFVPCPSIGPNFKVTNYDGTYFNESTKVHSCAIKNLSALINILSFTH